MRRERRLLRRERRPRCERHPRTHAMSGIFYGKEEFDALLIIAQMLCMQALFYLGLGLAYVLMDTLMGVPLSLDQFFSADVRA